MDLPVSVERSPARDGIGFSGLGRDARQGSAVGRRGARADEQWSGPLGGATQQAEQQAATDPEVRRLRARAGGSDRDRLFERQASPAMAQHPDDLLPADLDDADRPGRHEGRPRLPDADLVVEAGDGQPGARTDRTGAERREGRTTPRRARTRRRGAATSMRPCHDRTVSRADTTRRFPTSSCRRSWTSFASGRASPRARSSS